jgi:hypothetical protein
MRPEDRLQYRCRMFLDSHMLPPCWWSSVGHERKQTLRQGQMQKARGIRRGLPDVMIWAPGYFLGVELKSGKNTTTDAQDGFAQAMARNQFGYEVVRSVEQLGEALQRHGIPLAAGWQIAAMHHDAALDVPTKGHNKPPRARAAKPTARGLAKIAKARHAGIFT